MADESSRALHMRMGMCDPEVMYDHVIPKEPLGFPDDEGIPSLSSSSFGDSFY